MFRFFKKKSPPPAQPVQPEVAPPADASPADQPPVAPVPAPVEPTPALPVSPATPVAPVTPPVAPPAATPGDTPVSAPAPTPGPVAVPDEPIKVAGASEAFKADAPSQTVKSDAPSAAFKADATTAAPVVESRASAADGAEAPLTSLDSGKPDQAPAEPARALETQHPVPAEPTKPAAPARFWSRWTAGAKAEEAPTSPATPKAPQTEAPKVAEPLVATPVADIRAPEPVPAPAPAPIPAAAPVPTAPAPVPAATPEAAEPAPAPAAMPETAEPAPKKTSWLGRLKQGLARTGQNLGSLFVGVKVDENLFEELESALIMADAGLEATDKLLTALRARVRKERLDDPAKVKTALRELLADHLRPLEREFNLKKTQPLVVMIAGVNGAGKTTSIGKLAHTFQRQGASVLLAAGDTFRAAAREQLVEWGSRNNVSVISQEGGDPAAVAFDAVNAGRAREMGVVMVDTAGRLPTQLHLMEELRKIRRVIGKADSTAPHEVLLVVDGNTGQNVLAQIRAFDAAINLTGLVVTKLDGTAKGGTLAAVAAGSNGVRPIPVYWIGVGEGMEDLQPFVADEFAAALLSD